MSKFKYGDILKPTMLAMDNFPHLCPTKDTLFVCLGAVRDFSDGVMALKIGNKSVQSYHKAFFRPTGKNLLKILKESGVE